uniref:Myeloproliferative disease associated tumor antigen-5 n=1 Tax=Homo sapiens TaxID=9606 RepID=Q56UU7_HUMAN|nr:myeloproliferative disease associated tumor antigen-5 [Homo sapiens]
MGSNPDSAICGFMTLPKLLNLPLCKIRKTTLNLSTGQASSPQCLLPS